MPFRVRRSAVAALVVTIASMVLAAPAAHAGTAKQHLAAEIRSALRGSTAHQLDYRINDTAYGDFSRGANLATAPASNEKLFTTIALLHMVGPQFRYRTKVFATAPLVGHTIDGDLVVRGSGDPTLSRAGLLDIAKRLHASGIHHVTGHLIVDDSRYSHQTVVAGWKHSFVPTETGPVSAFTVDHNEWRRGASYDRDPTPANAKLFRGVLHHKHISVGRRTEIATKPAGAKLLLVHRSPDLTTIVDATLTDSINFDAEMMLREAGAQRSGHGSPASGVAAVKAVAHQLGLPFGTAHDGSGLSYTDRETPAAITRWLLALTSMQIYTTVYFALPLSCETGTLEHRLCGPNVRGQVRAKTGTLTHVSALSGYVTSKAGNPVTFSFLATGVKNFTKLYSRVDAAVALMRRSG